jgi:hypothetical protein
VYHTKVVNKDLPHGQGRHIEQEKVLRLLGSVTQQDSRLHGNTAGDGFIWVDALVGLLAIEEVRNELDDAWNTG